ncbi:MAG TPA: hypothetical protein PLV45_11710, partial [bacterium]|nr:hypothetical protein [bacterium]
MEIWRRVALLLGVSTGIILIMFVTQSPLISVQVQDFEQIQKKRFGTTEKDQYLRQLPLERFIEETTRDRIVTVEGPEWIAFFRDIDRAARGETGQKEWTRRISREERRWNTTPYTIFFTPDEEPIRRISPQFTGENNDARYLVLEHQGKKQYLKLTWRITTSDDFGFGGVRFGSGPEPPPAFFHPFRTLGYILIILAVTIYFVLPSRKREPDSLYYRRWGMILGDFASMLLFVPFFILPMFVVGGAVQAVLNGWMLSMVMWPLAAMGAWLLFVMGRYASYTITVRDDGIELETFAGRTFHAFSDIVAVQRLQLKPPRWFIGLLALAALAGRGSQSALAGGQAMMLAGSDYRGIGIRKKDGSGIFFWISNQMGKTAMKDSDRLLDALKRAGIHGDTEVRVIKRVLMPDGEAPGGRKQRSIMNALLLVFVIFPFAAIAVTGSVVLVKNAMESAESHRHFETPEELAAIQAPPLLEDASPIRSNTIRAGLSPLLKPMMPADANDVSNTYACGLATTPDDGFLIYGYAGPAGYLDGYAVKTDRTGRVEWQGFYGSEGKSSEYILHGYMFPDAGFLGLGTSGGLTSFQGGQAVWLVHIAADGTENWQVRWGDGTRYPSPCAVHRFADGRFLVAGTMQEPSTSIFLLEIGEGGTLINGRELDLNPFIGPGIVRNLRFLPSGEILLTGEHHDAGRGFKDMLAAKLPAAGKPLWIESWGGEPKESGYRILPMGNGDIIFGGERDLLDDSIRIYLVRTNADGAMQWEKTIGESGEWSLVELFVVS